MMEDVTGMSGVPQNGGSFGIKKIVDCKIGAGGQQMYKVKWEATWEPAENLVSCQHLVDEFWSLINKAKAKEVAAQQHRKIMMLEQNKNHINIDQKIDRLSEDDKADAQRLMNRSSATSVGDLMLMSPDNVLNKTSALHTQQNILIGASLTSAQETDPNSPVQKRKNVAGSKDIHTPVKVDAGGTAEQPDRKHNSLDVKSAGTASLKYLENFSSPYVKIIVVCKICNKEQSLKFASYWRQHYMTHSDTKPHKCPHCPKTFTRPVLMRKHVESKHSNVANASSLQYIGTVTPKSEHLAFNDVKGEDYFD